MLNIYIVSAIITVIITSIIYKTNWKKNKSIPLLPNWSKLIGIIILALCLVLPDIFNVRGVGQYDNMRDFLITISLLLFCFTADKNEDKSYNNKRLLHLLTSIASVTIIHQTLILLTIEVEVGFTTNNFITTILIIYLLTFHYFKKRF